MDYAKESLVMHKKHKGKLSVVSKVPLNNRDDLSLAYTPGVAAPCLEIQKHPELAYEYTNKGNFVAVVTNGTAVLGLGNIGALAGMPVMEGKAILFKEFANIDAFPICIDSEDPEIVIQTVKAISPTFGGINLEDIKAPECFLIEERLKEELDIPVFHDDQHGTAIVVVAALINALRVVKKQMKDVTAVINGAGAAGVATANLLLLSGIKDVILCDTVGAIYKERANGMNGIKHELAKRTNKYQKKGTLADVIVGADVFIGLSKPKTLTPEMIRTMDAPIVFAMANPTPEIMPDEAKEAGAVVVGTGRSDFANQINNSLAFPGVFRGALDAKARKITDEMKLAAAHAIADCVHDVSAEKVVPNALDKHVPLKVAEAVMKAAK